MAENVGTVSLGVDVDDSGVSSKISSIATSSGGLAKSILTNAFSFASGQAIYNGITRAMGSFVSSVKEGITYASDLNEVANVIDVTFGSSANSVENWASKATDSYGLTTLAAEQYAGSMGAMLKSSGVASGSIVSMSENLVGLAGDMASFYNISQDDAWEKIRSGISGETEPLKQLGINMSVANLQAYALSKGITTSYDSMSQAQQTQLRYNYLLSVTKDAQGDFTRTSGSFANQQRMLQNNWQSLCGTIGSAAIPILNQGAQILNGVLAGSLSNVQSQVGNLSTGVSNFLSTHQGQIKTFISDIVIGAKNILTGMGSALGWIITHGPLVAGVIGTIASAVGIYKTAQAISNVVTGISNGLAAISVARAATTAGATLLEAAATKTATGAQVGLNAAFLACPITWIILGIVALVAAFVILWNTCTPFRQFWQNLWKGIQDIAYNAGYALGTFFTKTLPEKFNEAVQKIITFFQSLPAKLGQIMANIGTAVLHGIISIGIFFMQLPAKIGYAIGFALGTIVKWGIDIGVWASTAIPQFLANVGTFFMQLPGKLWDALVQAITKLNQFGQNAIDWAAAQIPQIIGSIGTFFMQLPGKIWDALVNAINNLNRFGQNAENWAGTQIRGLIDNVIKMFQELPGNLVNIGKDIIQGLWNGLTGAWHIITDGIKSLTDGFVSGFKNALGIHSPSTVFAGIGGFISEGLANGISGKAPKVSSALKSLIPSSMTGIQANLFGGVAGFGMNSTTVDNSKAQTIKIEHAHFESKGSQNATLQQMQFLSAVV